MIVRSLTIAAAIAVAVPAHAQDGSGSHRTRVGLGPQLFPSYPGADGVSVGPLIVFDRTEGDAPFEFEAADEAAGFSLLESGGFSVGPIIGFEPKRDAGDVGAPVDTVDFTVELGGFVEYRFDAPFRVRLEARRGIGGHDGWIGTARADYIARDGDDWLFSIGPRVTLSNDTYHAAYFGISPDEAVRTGLPAYRAKGGVQAVGAAAGYLTQLTPRWGVYGYVRYDRLVGDAADSPLVRSFGSPNQFYGGVALTYTFGRGID